MPRGTRGGAPPPAPWAAREGGRGALSAAARRRGHPRSPGNGAARRGGPRHPATCSRHPGDTRASAPGPPFLRARRTRGHTGARTQERTDAHGHARGAPAERGSHCPSVPRAPPLTPLLPIARPAPDYTSFKRRRCRRAMQRPCRTALMTAPPARSPTPGAIYSPPFNPSEMPKCRCTAGGRGGALSARTVDGQPSLPLKRARGRRRQHSSL